MISFVKNLPVMSHPLHPFHTGRDERDCGVAIKSSNHPKICANCQTIIKRDSAKAFRCLPCAYSLCEKCTEGSMHPAHVEHPLFFISKKGKTLWVCDGCKQTGQQIGEPSCFNCAECDFSLCSSCFLRIKRPLHKHFLTKTDTKYVYLKSNGEWFCDSCRRNNTSSSSLPWHCNSCQFDLCDSCCRARHSEYHEHVLYKAEPMVIYPMYFGGWQCDHCRERFRPNENMRPYHCADCQFDLCERCVEQDHSQEQITLSNQLHNLSVTSSGYPVASPLDDQDEVKDRDTAVESDDSCVVCWEKSKDATIVHGSTGHMCCCYGCASRLERSREPCPICRAPIDMVVRVSNTT